MLIKALCDYADKKSASPNTDVIPNGFAKQDISYRIILSPDGDLLDIISVTVKETTIDAKGKEKTRELPRKIILPKRTEIPGIDSNFIEHRPLYIFGLNYEEGSFTPVDKTNKAKKSHEAFVKHELEFFDSLNSEVCTAYKKFIEKWNPEQELDNSILSNLGKAYKSSYFGFSLGVGKAELEQDAEFIAKYTKYYEAKQAEANNAKKLVCGILGEKLPIARVHDKIKFPKGQSSGCALICMKESAYESYGKSQSFNSNVSEKAMSKYTSTFNSLLSDKGHHTIIDDMTIVYFAMKNDDSAECSAFSLFFSNNSDVQTEQSIATIMQYAKGGYTTDQDTIKNLETDNDVTFYVAGLTPNSSRICQKFIYRDKFGNILNNLIKHQNDMKINANSTRPIYFSDIKKQLISPKSSKETVPPPLMTSIILSAFNNTKYPDSLLSTIVKRVKIDNDDDNNHYIKLNDTRVGIIKACLNRKYNKEEITMAWNEENKNPAYLCGGLFAIYEKIQNDSSGGGLNRTIKDAYFASACARPSSVFPTLAKLSQNHLRKLSDASNIYYSNLIAKITDGLDGEFPSTLDIDNQGRFIVGYYQMRTKFYTKNNNE